MYLHNLMLDTGFHLQQFQYQFVLTVEWLDDMLRGMVQKHIFIITINVILHIQVVLIAVLWTYQKNKSQGK